MNHLKVLSLRDRRRSSRELRDDINSMLTDGIAVYSSTVRRRLIEKGLVGRIAAKKPLLRENNSIGQRRIGIKSCGLMNLNLNSLEPNAECMYEDGRVKGTRMNAFCQL